MIFSDTLINGPQFESIAHFVINPHDGKNLTQEQQYQLFNKTDLETSDHQPLQIIQPGIHNKNQGPDFLESRIKLNNTLWVGSIEIHINSVDWELHKHSDDVHYNNVIVHVVWNFDDSIHFPFPTLCLKPLVPKMLLSTYNQIHQLSTFIHCEKNVHQVEPIIWE